MRPQGPSVFILTVLADFTITAGRSTGYGPAQKEIVRSRAVEAEEELCLQRDSRHRKRSEVAGVPSCAERKEFSTGVEALNESKLDPARKNISEAASSHPMNRRSLRKAWILLRRGKADQAQAVCENDCRKVGPKTSRASPVRHGFMNEHKYDSATAVAALIQLHPQMAKPLAAPACSIARRNTTLLGKAQQGAESIACYAPEIELLYRAIANRRREVEDRLNPFELLRIIGDKGRRPPPLARR